MYRKRWKNAVFSHKTGPRKKTTEATGISKSTCYSPIIHTSTVPIPITVLISKTGNSAGLVIGYYMLRCALLCNVYKHKRGKYQYEGWWRSCWRELRWVLCLWVSFSVFLVLYCCMSVYVSAVEAVTLCASLSVCLSVSLCLPVRVFHSLWVFLVEVETLVNIVLSVDERAASSSIVKHFNTQHKQHRYPAIC